MRLIRRTAYESWSSGTGHGGGSRDKAALDHWKKDITPSAQRRKWYGHVPEKWPEFQER